MLYAVKRLARGILLITFASAILRANGLLNRFEDVRRAEQLDESAADMLRKLYVY